MHEQQQEGRKGGGVEEEEPPPPPPPAPKNWKPEPQHFIWKLVVDVVVVVVSS